MSEPIRVLAFFASAIIMPAMSMLMRRTVGAILERRGAAVCAVALLAAVVAGCGESSGSKVRASFEGLRKLETGSNQSLAFAVSADGATVVGRVDIDNQGSPAFRWRAATGMVSLGNLPGANYSPAQGVSADGEVVVGQSGNLAQDIVKPYRWTSAGGMVALGALEGGNGQGSANGVSGDGALVVGKTNGPIGDTAVLWDASGKPQAIGGLVEQGQDEANAITRDGRFIAGTSSAPNGGVEPFRWEESTGAVGLGDIPGGAHFSIASAISGDGRVIVGQSALSGANGPAVAFKWTQETGMVQMPDLPDGVGAATALGVSDDGLVIVGYSVVPNDEQAVIWDGTSVERLADRLETLGVDLGTWDLHRAYAVTSDGQVIVGYGTSPEGALTAWRAVVPRAASIQD